jgi:hypothetical protein
MDTEEALQVADKAADRSTPAADTPSLVNMIYALEILADGYRVANQKARAWELSSTHAHDQLALKLRQSKDDRQRLDQRLEQINSEIESLNDELDHTQGCWSDLMEFIRTALGLDERALDDTVDVRRILGRALADARLFAQVRDLVNGDFRARFAQGDTVTINDFNNPATPGHTTRVADGHVWMAPVGTDPKDQGKWTHVGFAQGAMWNATFPKLADLLDPATADAFASPAVQEFPAGAPDPDARVTRVRRVGGSTEFVRAGRLSTGGSLWTGVDMPGGVFHPWSAIVKWRPVVEVRE